jgi:hypothetical protein
MQNIKDEQIIQFILIVIVISLVIYYFCKSEKSNEYENFVSTNNMCQQPIYQINPTIENFAIKKPAKKSAKPVKKPVVKSAARAVSGTIQTISPTIASDTSVAIALTPLTTNAPTNAPVVLTDNVVLGRLKFGQSGDANAQYLMRDGSNIRVVNGSLIVDRMCLSNNDTCLDSTVFDKIKKNKDFIDFGNDMLSHMYSPNNKDYIIYQDVFNALEAGAIKQIGNPNTDITAFKNGDGWAGRPMLRFGDNVETDGNGMLVNIPSGYSVLWIRFLNERRQLVKIYYDTTDSTGAYTDIVGIFGNEQRRSTKYSPDGGGSNCFTKTRKCNCFNNCRHC